MGWHVSLLQGLRATAPLLTCPLHLPLQGSIGRPVDVRVSATDSALVEQLYALNGATNCTVLIDDVQKLIDTENHPSLRAGAGRDRRQANDPWTWAYHEYDEVRGPPPMGFSSATSCPRVHFLFYFRRVTLARASCSEHTAQYADVLTSLRAIQIIRHFTQDIVPKHERIASVFNIGKSFEGREQVVVRISGGQHDSHPNGTARANGLPAFWMEALIHSREWITGASMYWVIEAILEEYGTNDQITKVVDQMDLYCESCTPFTRRREMHTSPSCDPLFQRIISGSRRACVRVGGRHRVLSLGTRDVALETPSTPLPASLSALPT
jgi:hypothetical protein